MTGPCDAATATQVRLHHVDEPALDDVAHGEDAEIGFAPGEGDGGHAVDLFVSAQIVHEDRFLEPPDVDRFHCSVIRIASAAS